MLFRSPIGCRFAAASGGGGGGVSVGVSGGGGAAGGAAAAGDGGGRVRPRRRCTEKYRIHSSQRPVTQDVQVEHRYAAESANDNRVRLCYPALSTGAHISLLRTKPLLTHFPTSDPYHSSLMTPQ